MPDGRARDGQATQRAGGQALDGVEALVARRFRVPLREIRCRWRCGARSALARHVAIYVEHVVLECSYARLARRFDRHASAVLRACRRIEDMRDDPAFDARLGRIEADVAALWRTGR